MYYLTVVEDGVTVSDHRPFDDFAAAVCACSEYYKPRFNGSVLNFTTEVERGNFARSYSFLEIPEEIDRTRSSEAERYARAVKSSNAHIYEKSLSFRIDSDFGLALTKMREDQDNAEE